MGGSKPNLLVSMAFAVFGMAFGAFVFRHAPEVVNPSKLYLMELVVEAFGACMVFVAGLAAAEMIRLVRASKLRVETETVDLGGTRYITLTNPEAFEFIEVKVSFELVERTSKAGAPFAGRLVLGKAESLAGVPPGRGKKNPGRLRIAVPKDVVTAWKQEASSRSALHVRATSVHPISNLRTITNTAEFTRSAALGEEQAGSVSGSPAGCISLNVVRAKPASA